ncbi:MAG: hypothetical protein FWC75_00250 [Oscillospiraceae bacterium]|nr:hypothetical protein [Oscillospiraceae bacterium]
MKYPRPKYLDPSVKTQRVRQPFGPAIVLAPEFDSPITPRENFRRSIARQNPLWMPNGTTDKITLGTNDIIMHNVRGMQIHSNFLVQATEDYAFKDWFNTDWTWVCVAGGAMLTPGTQLLDDITKWESKVEFPNLSEWGFKEKAEAFMKTEYDPTKALSYDMGRGVTERLVSIMGGYEDSMEALIVEPKAVLDFFNAYADFLIRCYDEISALYPLDIITIHDDWGTERDTFFSEKVMEELVFEPTKRIIDHIHANDCFVEWHTCGNVTRFFPYMHQLNVDIAQVQRRVVDFPKMKALYGDKIGFCAGPEGLDMTKPFTNEEYIGAIKRTVDIYGPGGGSYLMMFTPDEELFWDACAEGYYRSVELYEDK